MDPSASLYALGPRGVAQPGSAPALGVGGRGFKSPLPDVASRISFRPLGRDDFPLLTEWLNTPHVYEWWGSRAVADSLGGAGPDAATVADVTAKYDEELADEGVEHSVIEVDGCDVGMIQTYLLAASPEYALEIGEPVERTAGIDLLIGDPTAVGQGLGPRVIDEFVRTVVFTRGDVDRCVAGPDVRNTRSIRAFEKAGFRSVRDATVTGGGSAPERVMVRTI
jgi:aminoglycoside 6'-N-acetyltransferase